MLWHNNSNNSSSINNSNKQQQRQQQQQQSLRAADDRFTSLWGALHRWRSHPNFVGGASFNKWDHRSTQSQLSRPMSSGHYTFVELGRPSNKLMHASLTAMVHTTCASWDTCPWWGPANTYHLWLVGPGSYLPPVPCGTRIYPGRRPGRKLLILI